MNQTQLNEHLQKYFSRLGQLELARLEVQARHEEQLAAIAGERDQVLAEIAKTRVALQMTSAPTPALESVP